MAVSLAPSAQPVAYVTVVQTVLVCLAAFGLNLTTEQIAAVVAVANSIAAAIIWTRVSPAKPA